VTGVETYKDWGDFVARYTPQANHLDGNASVDGFMFETFGEELAHVKSVLGESPRRVWTIIEADGIEFISAGYHFVNRLGYLITAEEFGSEEEEYLN
jgi:hypothetical protein